MNKISKNKILLLIVGILLCITEVLSFVQGPAHAFDFFGISTFIGQSTGIIAFAALGFAYTARYEEHKAAGLEEK